MSKPEKKVIILERYHLMLDEDPALTAVLCKMIDWQRWVINERGEGAYVWMSSRQMSEQLLGLYKRQKVTECFAELVKLGYLEKTETPDPTDPPKWKVDLDAVAEEAGKFVDAAGMMRSDGTVTVSDNGQTCPNTDSTKSTNNDCLTNKQTRRRENRAGSYECYTCKDVGAIQHDGGAIDCPQCAMSPDESSRYYDEVRDKAMGVDAGDPPEQPDPVSTEPPDDLTQWIVWRGARMDYDISPQQAMKVAMGVADFNLSDDEERRYIRETMTSCAIADKAPGQWAYYVVQRSNYETWAGDDGPDGGPGGGRALMDELRKQGIK